MRIMTRTQYDAIVDIVTEQQNRITELETELEKRKKQVEYLNDLVFKANDRYVSLHHKAVNDGLKIDFPATMKLHEDKLFF